MSFPSSDLLFWGQSASRAAESTASLPDPLSLILILVFLSLAPFLAVMVTSFIKIVVVLNLVRNALGIQQIPPNLVINGLALILSVYIMALIGQETFAILEKQGLARMSFNQLSAANLKEIFTEARLPLQAFLLKHSHERERAFFVSTTKKLWSKEAASKVQPDDLRILIPAFTVSELTAAFPIGFLLYLPFIAINLIVSNILLAMGVKAGLASFILVVYMGFLFVFFQDSFLKTEQILGLLRRVVS